MNIKEKITISVNDLKELLYFSLLKFNEDTLHRSGNSSKRDAFGGYLERWLNRIVETKIFNHLLKKFDKDYKICPDNYIYVQGHEKNAPDILGLQRNDKIFNFGYFENNSWIQKSNFPSIEIKAIRDSQSLLAVRDTQNSDYYCFVEVAFRNDYITSFFSRDYFSKDTYEKIISKMNPNIFLQGNQNDKIILNPEYINFSSEVGTIKLIGIFNNNTFKKYSRLVKSDCSPMYLESVEINPPRIQSEGDIVFSRDIFNNTNNSINKNYKNETYLPVIVNNPSNYNLISDKFKSSTYFKINSNDNIFENEVSANDKIKLKYKEFQRTSKWNEYLGLKKDFSNKVPDCTEELINRFDKIVADN